MNWNDKKLICAVLCAALLLGGWAPAMEPARPTGITPKASHTGMRSGTAPADLNGTAEPFRIVSLAAAPGQGEPAAAAASGLAIPTTFTITRPDKKLTTSYSSYFITGTSNPDKPVYFGSTEIQRLGSKGTFGVLVDLAVGSNSFAFSQDGKTETVTIERTASSGKTLTQADIQASMVPAVMSGVERGASLSVGCIAPAGAAVSATFDGSTVPLKQANTEVKTGAFTTYTGKITVDGSYDEGVTKAAGPVQYDVSYDGSSKRYTSTGQVYVAGDGGSIVVEVASYLGFVYPDTKNLAAFKETVKTGARDTIKAQNNEYFELSSGGFVPKSMMQIVEGKASSQNKLSSVHFTADGKSELFTFQGTGKPFYNTKISENVFYLTLYNTSGTPKADTSGSRMVSGSTVSQGDNGSVTYKFPLSARLWGYDVTFDGKNTVLTLKHMPKVSSSSQPLEGMTIVLDPGHGGTDPGAMGLAGKTGPSEADVNLANAKAAGTLLTELGAKVILTRDSDSYLSLDDRLKMIETSGADLFLSIHHNSLGENVDANKVSGMEIYYHTPLSKSSANTMMSGLSAGLNRNNRSVNQSYYRVTLMPYAPAMLLELGFMSNPVEYEKAVSSAEMKKVAAAVAEGIQAALQ